MIGRFGLEGRTALITGASGGLGEHFARTLAAAGASVVLAARRCDVLVALVDDLVAAGFTAEAMSLDVADASSIAAASDRLLSIDILINNAGVVRDRSALDQSIEDWDTVIDTNLKGAFLVAQAVAPHMKAKGRGSIINVASILGLRQAGGVLPYAVSKAGLIQMTKVLALEWARHGIRVNAIAPGYIKTDLNSDFWESDAGKTMLKRIPQRHLGNPEDLDGPLLLLASDASAFMTGSVLVVDGGHLVSTL